MWSEYSILQVSNYSFLEIEFASDTEWDVHLKKVIGNGKKKNNQLHSVQ